MLSGRSRKSGAAHAHWKRTRRRKELLKRLPLPGNFASWIYRTLRSKRPVANSADYWKKRRSTGGDCGVGSHAFFAECAKLETPGPHPRPIKRLQHAICPSPNPTRRRNRQDHLCELVLPPGLKSCCYSHSQNPPVSMRHTGIGKQLL